MDYIPTAQDFQAARVTNPGQSEVVRQRLYDWNLYPATGISQLAYFQQPVGQGITTALGGTVGSGKTQHDTNMTLGGQLPSGQQMLAESIEVIFFPGSVNTANTYTPAAVKSFAAVAALTTSNSSNDVNVLYQSGLLELNILAKNYLRETPLGAFPPKAFLNLNAAIASNSATTSEVGLSQSHGAGRPYYLSPNVLIQPAVNFEILLRWPAAVATPSGFNGRLGVVIDGFVMRASQ
jgi:hypothetical protein